MDDDSFIEQFADQSLPFDQWNHRAHVMLAYLHVTRHGFAGAVERLRAGIRAYNAAHQVPDHPTSGYHETLTRFWLHLIQATILEYGPAPTADEFYDANPQLSQKKIHRLFYSRRLFMSPQAKIAFIEPDLTALPGSMHAGHDTMRPPPPADASP